MLNSTQYQSRIGGPRVGWKPYGTSTAPTAPTQATGTPIQPAPLPIGGSPAQNTGGGGWTPESVQSTGGNNGRRTGQISQGSYDLFTKLFPMLQSQMQFGAQLEPQRQAQLQQLLNMSGPEGLAQLARMFSQQQRGQAVDSGQLLAGQLASQGVSQSGQAGALLNAQNQATKASNNYSSNLQGLPNQLAAGQQAMNLYGMAQNPNLQNLGSLGNLIYGRPDSPRHDPNGGIGGLIGTAVGMYTGMGGDWGQVFS
jgi:hypothetical protein